MPDNSEKVKQRRKQAKKVTDKIIEGIDKVQQSDIIESGKNFLKSFGRLLDGSKEETKQ